LAASLVMGGLAFAAAAWLGTLLPGRTLASQAAVALGAGLAGLAAYGGLVKLLRIEAAGDFVAMLRRRLRR